MAKANKHCIGSQCRTYIEWKNIFGETLPDRKIINHRIKQGMTFLESITYIKPQVIYIGEVYGRFEVIKDPYVKNKKAYCKVLCSCGTEKEVRVDGLKSGTSTSCGCFHKEVNQTHGLSKHPLFNVWHGMNKRCNNPNVENYSRYGAKGVTVCWEWHQSNPNGLQNFIDDMYPTFVEGYFLDKDIRAIPGQPKVYSKDTCCWVTPTNSSRATSKVILSAENVVLIKQRLACGEHPEIIAEYYGVGRTTIVAIKTGQNWQDISP